MKENVEKMVKKFNPSEGLIVSKEYKTFPPRLCIEYHFKGDQKFIDFIHENFLNEFSAKEQNFSFELAEIGKSNESKLVTIVHYDNKFSANNETITLNDLTLINIQKQMDNHVQIDILFKYKSLCHADERFISKIEDFIDETVPQLNHIISNEENLFKSITSPFGRTFENSSPSKAKKGRKKKENN